MNKSLFSLVCILTLSISLIVLQPAYTQNQDTLARLQQIIERADEVSTAAQDVTFTSYMTMKNLSEVRTAVIWQKDGNNRLMKFTGPPSHRNKGILSTENDDYVAFFNVDNESGMEMTTFFENEDLQKTFMESDFSYEDMRSITLSESWQPTLANSGMQDGKIKVGLIPKPGVVKPYSRMEVYINPESYVVEKIKYYDESGTYLKTMLRQDIEFYEEHNYYVSHKMIMMTSDHWTQIVMYPAELDRGGDVTQVDGSNYINRGLPDDIFTRQWLETDVEYIIQYVNENLQ